MAPSEISGRMDFADKPDLAAPNLIGRSDDLREVLEYRNRDTLDG